MLYRWPDKGLRFELNFSSELASSAGIRLMKMSLTGKLDVFGTVENGRTTVLVSLHDPQLVLDGTTDPEKVVLLQTELSTPVQGVYKDGILEKMRFAPGSSTFAVGIWRSLLSYLQIADSPDGGVPFTVSEYDANGKYVVSYTQLSEGDGTWQKKKSKYQEGLLEDDFSSTKGKHPVPVLVSSSGELTIQSGVLHRIAASDKMKVSISGTGSLESETSFNLVRTEDSAQIKTAALKMPKSLMVLRADEPFTTEIPMDAMDPQRMEGLTFDTLLAALVSKASDPRRQSLWDKKNDAAADAGQSADAEKWTEDWSRYFSAIPAFFRQQPKTMKRAEKEIRNGSPAARSLIGGLSSSGIPAAQKLLFKLARDESLDIKVREAAIRNLVQCNKPTVETATNIRRLEDHPVLSRYAVFGAGIIARKFQKEGHPEEATELVAWLLKKLETEKASKRRHDILRGLSNTADESILEPMVALLQNTVPVDRAGALEALRLLDAKKVDDILATHMDETLEPSEMVRRTAIQTAARRSREEPLLSKLIEAAKNDTSKKVKREARRVLFAWSQELPDLKEILMEIAAADKAAEAAKK